MPIPRPTCLVRSMVCVNAVVEGQWWSANLTDGILLNTVAGGVLQVRPSQVVFPASVPVVCTCL